MEYLSIPRKAAGTFQDLVVWQKAHELVIAIYRLASGFPRSEIYGLSSQMRRAAVSVAANIAEGFKRRGKPDKSRFLNIAQGSLEEVRYYLILAKDLGYGFSTALMELLAGVSQLLAKYRDSILASMP